MLSAHEGVEPRVVRRRHIPGAIGCRGDQRGVPVPELRGRVGEYDLRQPSLGVGGMIQIGAGLAGRGIAGCRGGEGEGVRRIVVLLHHRGMPCRLHEPAVEASAAAGAGDLQEGPVKGQLAALVHIQPVVQHPPDKTSRLADAEDQGPRGRRAAIDSVVADVGQQVPDARQPCRGHIGVLGHVGQLVDHAGLEPAHKRNPPRPAGLFGRQEPPGGSVDRLTRIAGSRPLGQHSVRVIRRRRLVGQAAHAGIGGDPRRRADRELVLDLAGDRRSIRPHRDRRREHKRARGGRLGRDIPGPGREQQGEAVPHQKAVAGVARIGRVVIGRGPAIHLAEDGDAAPIVHVIDQRRALRLDRAQHQELGLEGDEAAGVAWGVLQVDNASISRRLWVESKVGDAPDLLV